MMPNTPKHIAFIVGVFPAPSEAFIIGQIADLMERGFDVSVYSFARGQTKDVAEKYQLLGMDNLVNYLDFPADKTSRLRIAFRSIWQLLQHRPVAILRALNVFKYGADAWSLKLLCWAGPLATLRADLVHCHFGTVADKFRIIRQVLGLAQPWVTTFYGYDVSQVPRQKGESVYRELAAECPQFLVMSEDMKNRVVALGFDEAKIAVLPVGIDTRSYPYHRRTDHDGPVKLATVARLVEKKGVDDLIRALADVRKRISRPVVSTIVGDGPLREQLYNLARAEGVDDVIDWKGFMRQEDMVKILDTADIYVQPSKTSSTGDME